MLSAKAENGNIFTAILHPRVLPDGHGLMMHGVLELVVGSEGDESAPRDAEREEHLLRGVAPHRPVEHLFPSWHKEEPEQGAIIK